MKHALVLSALLTLAFISGTHCFDPRLWPSEITWCYLALIALIWLSHLTISYLKTIKND